MVGRLLDFGAISVLRSVVFGALVCLLPQSEGKSDISHAVVNRSSAEVSFLAAL